MKMKMINFDKQANIALYEQIYERFKEDIYNGYLKKGDQLPSIRKAVELFHVSKTSIERAYEQLLMEGLIVSIAQKGYFVDVDAAHIKVRKEIMLQPNVVVQDHVQYDFRSQTMDKDAFDITLWKRYIKDVLDHEQKITTYGDAQGEPELRHALADYAYAMRGVICRDEQIVISSSFQSLLYMLCGLLNKPMVFGMEKHVFLPAKTVCEDYGNEVVLLDMDDEGIQMEQLYASNINVLYINSVSCGRNHQPIKSRRRKELLTWAKQKKAIIIEDDHNGELRYHTRMTPAMQGFDNGEHIIYIGSFSKLLLPSLRISYMVLSTALLQRFLQRIQSYSPTSSKIEQLALAHYMADGHLERHVKRLRKRYSVKSAHMYELLKTYFKDADIYLEESALQFLLRFNAFSHIEEFVKEAKQKGIWVSSTAQKELVLSFSAIRDEDMEDAVKKLYEIIAPYMM